jgi:3-isopropylmalate/(R)-2-methylmalate dehydratase small subunit
MSVLRGRAHRFGANVDTDSIIPARYLTTTDAAELGLHCMEALDPDFTSRVKLGDVIVAEENFGAGSSREHAPIAIKAAGISCVVATSFARIFFRNAINLGLPIVESANFASLVGDGDEVEIDLATGRLINLTTGTTADSTSFPEFMRELLNAGGLVPYLKSQLETSRNE